MPTISSLSYQILADASGFTKGANLARKEVTELKRLFVETRSPVERLTAAEQQLHNLYKAKKIDADLYSRSLEKIRKEHASNDEATKKSIEIQRQVTSGINQLGVASKVSAALLNPYTAAIVAVGSAATVAGTAIYKLTSSVVSLTKYSMAEIDTLVDQASKIGASAIGLGSLHLAGQQASVSTEAIDKAIQKLTRSMGDEEDSGKKAAEGLKAIGLASKDLHGLRPEDQFYRIATGIKAVGDPAVQAALAFKIFGKSGSEMIPLLIKGGEALRQQEEQWKKLAGGLSEAEYQMIGAMTDLGDASKVALGGIGNIIAAELSPALTMLHEDFQRLSTSAVVQGGLRDVFSTIAGEVVLMREGVSATVAALSNPILLRILETAAPLTSLAGKLAGGAISTGTEYARTVAEDAQHRDRVKADAAAKQREAEAQKTSDAIKAVERQAKAEEEAEKRAKKKREAESQRQGKVADDYLKSANDLYTGSRTKSQAYEDQIAKINRTFAMGAIDIRTWAQAIKKAYADLHKEETEKEKKDREEQQRKDEQLQKRFKSEARRIAEAARDPKEQLERDAEKLRLLYAKGNLTSQEFEQANAKLYRDSRKEEPERFAAVASRGSDAALQIIARWQQQGAIEEETKKFHQEQLEKSSKMAASLEGIDNRLEKLIGDSA